MGVTPEEKAITINFDCQFEVQLKESTLSSKLAAFADLLPHLLTDFFQKVLVGFGERAMVFKKKPFACGCCGNDEDFTWKTRHGKKTKLHAFYQRVEIPQLQVPCKRCGSKLSITRKLLGMEPKKRIGAEIYRKLGLLGSLTSYRARYGHLLIARRR